MTRIPKAGLLAACLLLAAGCDSSGGQFGPPRSAEILRVTVSAAPFKDPIGNGWDGDSDGDIYFGLFDEAVPYKFNEGGARLNALVDVRWVTPLTSVHPWYPDANENDLPMVWDVAPGHRVYNLREQLYVGLFDYNPATGDFPIGATETFSLLDIAPARVTNEDVILDLGGFDVHGDPTTAVRVSLTVRFLD